MGLILPKKTAMTTVHPIHRLVDNLGRPLFQHQPIQLEVPSLLTRAHQIPSPFLRQGVQVLQTQGVLLE